VLLAALETHDLGTVGAIAYNHLGRDATRNELVAARRAARRLTEDGRVRALHLGECRRCGELSEIWTCRVCGHSCQQVLAVARLDQTGISSVMPLNGLPDWVSVAPVPNEPQATLTPGGDL
jgi:hypothetical protein